MCGMMKLNLNNNVDNNTQFIYYLLILNVLT